jgi:hypothetical protein
LLTVVVVIAVLALVALLLSIRIVQQYEEGVLFRPGRVVGVRTPGLTFIVPMIEDLRRVSLRIVTMPIQSQGIMTRDNVSVDVSAVADYRVVDPHLLSGQLVLNTAHRDGGVGRLARVDSDVHLHEGLQWDSLVGDRGEHSYFRIGYARSSLEPHRGEIPTGARFVRKPDPTYTSGQAIREQPERDLQTLRNDRKRPPAFSSKHVDDAGVGVYDARSGAVCLRPRPFWCWSPVYLARARGVVGR